MEAGPEESTSHTSQLNDSVSLLNSSLDRRSTWPNILHQFDSLAADGEAKPQIVPLHNHTSLD